MSRNITHRRLLFFIIALGVFFDLLSMTVWERPYWATPITTAVIVAVAAAAFWDIRCGVAAVLLELLWGSHGYLLRLPAGGIDLSLRMGLFLAVLAATVWHLRRGEARVALLGAWRRHPIRWPAVVFLATLLVSFFLGIVRHPFHRVFFDANAWGFLLLIPAFLLAALRQTDNLDRSTQWPMTPIFLIGAFYLILRTFALLFIFSHDLGGFWLAVYQWIRDTRLGEVTIFPGGFPRVFLPSMVLLFPALLIAAQRMVEEKAHQEIGGRLFSLAVFGGSIAVLIIGLSRSYWFAGGALIIIGIVWLAAQMMRPKYHSQFRAKLRMNVRRLAALIAAVGIAIVLAVIVVRLPYPKPLTTAGVGETLFARLSADAAVSNRWQQLKPLRFAIQQHPIIGHGFGATVTYESKDPRTLAAFPDGRYTTTAFEWGYLDDWLERGVVGLLVEFWFLSALIWRGVRQGGRVAPLAWGLLAVAITHATSPYLNHPLGLGLIMIVLGIV